MNGHLSQAEAQQIHDAEAFELQGLISEEENDDDGARRKGEEDDENVPAAAKETART